MIVLSNSVAQTIPVGQTVTFDKTVLHTGCGECHRPGSGSVKLRSHGIYRIEFSGDVTSATAGATVQLAIDLSGSPMRETVMSSTSGAANTFNNVSGGTYVETCCDGGDTVTVENIGTGPLILAPGMNLRIIRVA